MRIWIELISEDGKLRFINIWNASIILPRKLFLILKKIASFKLSNNITGKRISNDYFKTYNYIYYNF